MENIQYNYEFKSSFGKLKYGRHTAPNNENADTIILVHGTPFNAHVWEHVVEKIKDYFNIIWLDLPGYGESEKFDGQQVQLRYFAKGLAEFIGHLQLPSPPHLVGHDFGAATVLGIHLIENVEVKSLTIIDGVVLNPWGTDYAKLVHENEAVFASTPSHIHKAMLKAQIATASSRILATETVDRLINPWLSEIGQAAYYRQIAQYDFAYTEILADKYSSINKPTLILWGEEDQWVDIKIGKKLHHLIKDSTFIGIPDAGHLSMLDCPGFVSKNLLTWLQNSSI